MTDQNTTTTPESNENASASARPLTAILLAAGQSKRMQSDLVKVLHDVCGRPMLAWVIDACKAVGCESIYVVIGHQGEQVREAFANDSVVRFVEQHERLGTGHAVQQAESALAGFAGDVIVLAGDGPLIRAATLQRLVDVHRQTNASSSMATSIIDNPDGYGRIVRNDDNTFEAIVEQKDATETQLAICEINPSYYCFDAQALWASLKDITNQNASGEYYITDVLGIQKSNGLTVSIVDAVPAEDVLSVNTGEQLKEVQRILTDRLGHMQEART